MDNQMKRWFAGFCLLVILALGTMPVVADNHPPIRMGTPFQNGAVLQRGMPVPVWGWSTPGMKVRVTFAGQVKQATADKSGKWTIKLDPLKATAKPQWMEIYAEGKGLMLTDILVGEVWIASGQSNMQWLASKCDVGRVLQAGIKARVEAGKESQPIIREAKVTDVFSALHPIEKAQGEWISDGANMSAIAYAFAYELYKELGVPIGILNCSFSSTAIEAWTPREGFAAGKDAYTKSVYQKILESDPSTPKHKAAWAKYYKDVEAAIMANDDRVANGKPAEPVKVELPGNVRGNREASWLYNARMHPMVPYAVRGAIWNQGYANSGGGLDYYANLHSLTRGWRMKWDRPNLPIYFHQFYTAKAPEDNHPTFSSVSEMRLGTAMARDIPNTGMASQIDIAGSVHYYRKALPGQRFALHALKNQYGKDIVADGPFFNSYKVDGRKLTVSFDHAEGGLIVGQVETDNKKPAVVNQVVGGDKDLGLFFIAGQDKVWHRAACKIVGNKIELTAPGVTKPIGVSYASGGVGFQPAVYNKALLPLTPFTYYDNKVVTKADWPHDPPKVAGFEPDASEGGLLYEYRKMPILSTQFRDNAVLQHGKPVTIWGSAVHNWGPEHHASIVGNRKAVIKFSFDGIEETIEVKPGMEEWSVTLDPMKPSAKPKTLKVRLEIDGETVHERTAENIVVGDVWYVAAPRITGKMPAVKPAETVVRVMRRKAKRDAFSRASRFSVAVSTTPKNRFACEWLDARANDIAGSIAHRIAAGSKGRPVGVIFMQTNPGKDEADAPLKAWLPFESLSKAPSLAEDYATLGARYPGSPTYNENLRRYVADWKAYWGSYIPEMIQSKAVPDGSAWGVLPNPATPGAKSSATGVYNVMVHSFTPTALTGIVFLTSPAMFEQAKGDAFVEQVALVANGMMDRFGRGAKLNQEPVFVLATPKKLDAAKRVQAAPIKANVFAHLTIDTVADRDQAEHLEAASVAKSVDTMIKLIGIQRGEQ